MAGGGGCSADVLVDVLAEALADALMEVLVEALDSVSHEVLVVSLARRSFCEESCRK